MHYKQHAGVRTFGDTDGDKTADFQLKGLKDAARGRLHFVKSVWGQASTVAAFTDFQQTYQGPDELQACRRRTRHGSTWPFSSVASVAERVCY